MTKGVFIKSDDEKVQFIDSIDIDYFASRYNESRKPMPHKLIDIIQLCKEWNFISHWHSGNISIFILQINGPRKWKCFRTLKFNKTALKWVIRCNWCNSDFKNFWDYLCYFWQKKGGNQTFLFCAWPRLFHLLIFFGLANFCICFFNEQSATNVPNSNL